MVRKHFARLAVLCVATVLSTAVCAEALQTHFSLAWNATFAPPHNEPVVGDRVARYRLQLKPRIEVGWLHYRLTFTAWGVNRWQPTGNVGGGMESWSNSDWSVEKWRSSMTHRIKFGPKSIHLYVEYYYPFDGSAWKGHGLETHYYLLTGIGGVFW